MNLPGHALPVCSYPFCTNPAVLLDEDGDMCCRACFDLDELPEESTAARALRWFRLGLWAGALGNLMD